MIKIPRYKLILDDGSTKTVTASTPRKAEYKFYGSDYHFRTEKGIEKVLLHKKIYKKQKKPKRRTMGYLDLRW